MFAKYFCIGFILIILACQLPAFSQQVNEDNLNKVESQLFNQNFNNDDIDKRLNRIETTVFGKTFKDMPQQRLLRVGEFLNNSGQSNTLAQTRPNPIQKDNSQEQNTSVDNSVTDYPAVSQIELRVFDQTFGQENIYARLNRLEKRMFGTIFSSSSLSDRVIKLQKALNIYNNKPDDDDDNSYIDKGSLFSHKTKNTPEFMNIEANNSEFFNDDFFKDQTPNNQTATNQITGSGILNFIQTLALPVLACFLNSKTNNQYPPAYSPQYAYSGNPYNYPNYYGPAPYTYNPYYGQYYPPQHYNVQNATPYGIVNTLTRGNTGMGVQILP